MNLLINHKPLRTALRAAAVLIILAHCWVTLRPAFSGLARHAGAFSQKSGASRIDAPVSDPDGSLLRWVGERVPRQSVLLICTRSDYGVDQYIRASYTLVPRAVWWATPSPARWNPDWRLQVSLQPGDLAATLSRIDAGYLWVEDIPPAELHLAETTEVRWYSQEPLRYLVVVPNH
jgi:hypothetical protein